MRHFLLAGGIKTTCLTSSMSQDQDIRISASGRDWVTWTGFTLSLKITEKKKKPDKIYEIMVFKILDFRHEGQWSLREGNKPSESYSCPQLTAWRVSGLLCTEEKSRYCPEVFLSWGDGEGDIEAKVHRVYGAECQTGESFMEGERGREGGRSVYLYWVPVESSAVADQHMCGKNLT